MSGKKIIIIRPVKRINVTAIEVKPRTIIIKRPKVNLDALEPIERFTYLYKQKLRHYQIKDTPSPDIIDKSRRIRIIQFKETNQIDIVVINHHNEELLYDPLRELYVGRRYPKTYDGTDDVIYITIGESSVEYPVYNYEIWNFMETVLPIDGKIYSNYEFDECDCIVATHQIEELP